MDGRQLSKTEGPIRTASAAVPICSFNSLVFRLSDFLAGSSENRMNSLQSAPMTWAAVEVRRRVVLISSFFALRKRKFAIGDAFILRDADVADSVEEFRPHGIKTGQ